MAGVAFLGMVTRDEAIAALEQRITNIRGFLRQTDFVIASHNTAESPEHVRELMRLTAARMASEIAWAEAFIARLRAGEYSTASDPHWRREPAPPAKPAKRKPAKRKPAPPRKASAARAVRRKPA
jgi:hypothetical protein